MCQKINLNKNAKLFVEKKFKNLTAVAIFLLDIAMDLYNWKCLSPLQPFLPKKSHCEYF